VWALVECSTGYVYNFEVYQGKDESNTEVGQTANIVKRLIAPLQRWHIIGMDGFFSSVSLFDSLYKEGFLAVATTRNNREHFPKTLLAVNTLLEEGQYLYRQRDNLVCVSWMDQKPVNLLSTYCDPKVKQTVCRWRKSMRKGRRDKRVEVPCPEVLVEYSKWMRGVDVLSQRESYSHIGRKSRRWWPRLAWFLIDVAVNNAYVLYREYIASRTSRDPAAQSQKGFRRALMHALVGTFTSRKKRGRPWHTPKVAADEPQHIPLLRQPQRPCVVCAPLHSATRGGHKPRTTEGCETCGAAVHIACWKGHLPCQSEEEDEQVG
jgi:hypothetical protein